MRLSPLLRALLLGLAAVLAPAATGAFSAAAAAPAPEPDVAPAAPMLSLETCLGLAERESPLIRAAHENIRVFEAKASEAFWGWFPDVKFEATVGPSPAHRGNALDGRTDFKDWGVLVDLRVEAVMPVYTFGKIRALQRAADRGVDVARAQLRIAEGEVAVRVRRAFHGYEFAEGVRTILRRADQTLTSVRRDLERLRDDDDDDFDQIDLLRVRVHTADLARAIEDNERLRLEALSSLGQLLPAGSAGDLAARLPPADLRPVAFEALDLAEYLARATRQNPLLQLAQSGVKAREALADLKLAELLPDFFLGGQYNITYGSASDPQASPFANDPWNSWGGGAALGVRYKFDLPRGLARRRQALAEWQKTRAEQQAAADLVALEIEQAYRRVADLSQRRAASDDSRRAARGWYWAQKSLYDSGFCTVKDLLDALAQSYRRDVNALRVVYDLNVAVAELAAAVGAPGGAAPAAKP